MRVALMLGRLEDAGGIPEDPVPALQATRRGLPAAAQACVEQLAIRWLVIPDGDRRHGTQSGGVEDEVARAVRNQDVVGVLVLCENRFDREWRLLPSSPIESELESRQLSDHLPELRLGVLIEASVVKQWDVAQPRLSSTIGPMMKMELPNGSWKPNVRPPQDSFNGGRCISTFGRHSSK